MRRLLKRAFLLFVATFILVVLCALGFFFVVNAGLFGKLPTDEELKNIQNYEASDIYSSDGVLIGRYFVENRAHTKLEDISPNLINALISTEDTRFYEHKGIDQISLMRVLFKSIILGQNTGGGSTISQQLIKNLFGRGRHGVLTMPVNKIKESILANNLNQLYTKEQILELYFNTVSFGEDTYGIETACERFFGTSAKEIAVEQAAVLIGMLKAPTSYNPRLNPKDSKTRRNTVLALMKSNNYLSEDELVLLIDKEIELNYSRNRKNEFSAGYFKEYAKRELEEILEDLEKPDGRDYHLEQDGLKIITTVNSLIQHSAEKSVNYHLQRLTKILRKERLQKLKSGPDSELVWQELQKTNRFKRLENKEKSSALQKLSQPVQTTIYTFKGERDTLISPMDSVIHSLCMLQFAFLAADPNSGAILGYVGGADYKYFPYDRVFAQRQVGSIFKPIVYAKALQNGVKECDYYKNEQIKYTQYEDWTPANSDNEYGGKYSVVGALTNSINTVSVQLLMEQGINETIDFAYDLGIDNEIPEKPSLALGTASLTPWEMLGVYAVFANGGKKTEFYSIEKILDRDGNEIYRRTKEEKKEEIIEQKLANRISQMLMSVVDSGTAQRLRTRYKFKYPISGKTGTTQNQTDGWFVGYNPNYVSIVWSGADQPVLHLSSIKDGQGANMALPIWADVFRVVTKNSQLRKKHLSNKNYTYEFECNYYLPEKTGFIRDLFKRKTPKENDNDGLEPEDKKKGILNKIKNKLR